MSINREAADLAMAEASDKSRPSVDAHLLRGDEAFKAFGSSKDGISSDEAKSRLDRYGPNQLQDRRKTSAWMRLLLQFHNPLIYVLAVAAGLAALTGEVQDALFILAVLLINALLGSYNETRAEKSSQALQKLLKIRATVYRDGEAVEITGCRRR